MSAHPSLEILRARIAALPSVLEAALAAPLPGTLAQREALVAARRFIVTGGGLSEGPARVLCALLRGVGREARFVPQSAFVDWAEPADAGAVLVLFSQGLAPNARLPLVPLEAAAFGRGLLVTSVAPGTGGVAYMAARLSAAGQLVWTLPPEREDGLLLRVLGPSVALIAAMRIVELCAPGQLFAGPAERAAFTVLPEQVARRLGEPGPDLFGVMRQSIAIAADARLVELAMPLRWKLLEGLRVPDPPVWDVLQVAHGPLQSFYEHPTTLLTLRAAPAQGQVLWDRLARVLRPDLHRLIELRATLPGPAGLVELDAALDAALLATLEAHPMPLDDWPSRGLDGPLYDVDPDELAR